MSKSSTSGYHIFPKKCKIVSHHPICLPSYLNTYIATFFPFFWTYSNHALSLMHRNSICQWTLSCEPIWPTMWFCKWSVYWCTVMITNSIGAKIISKNAYLFFFFFTGKKKSTSWSKLFFVKSSMNSRSQVQDCYLIPCYPPPLF